MKPRWPRTFCASVGIAVLLSGCGGAKEQYFRLASSGNAPLRSSGLAVGIGSVTLPSYIDRAELVFQSDANRYEVPVKARWAGSLQENVTQVLAADVGRRLGSGNVLAFPWPAGSRLRYQVTVDVRQFHAVSGQGAILEASWRVEEPESHQVLHRSNGSFHSPINGDGYGPVVTAESDLLDQLAGAITRSLAGR